MYKVRLKVFKSERIYIFLNSKVLSLRCHSASLQFMTFDPHSLCPPRKTWPLCCFKKQFVVIHEFLPSKFVCKKSYSWALAGVALWIECQPVNQKGHRFNSQLGHMLGLWTGFPVGGVGEATTHWCFSFSLSSPLSESK